MCSGQCVILGRTEPCFSHVVNDKTGWRWPCYSPEASGTNAGNCVCMCLCVVWVVCGQTSIHTKSLVFVMLDSWLVKLETSDLSCHRHLGFYVIQGCKVWLQSGSDWPQMEQIRDFLRLYFSAFGSYSKNVLKYHHLKMSRIICPIYDQSDLLCNQTWHPSIRQKNKFMLSTFISHKIPSISNDSIPNINSWV